MIFHGKMHVEVVQNVPIVFMLPKPPADKLVPGFSAPLPPVGWPSPVGPAPLLFGLCGYVPHEFTAKASSYDFDRCLKKKFNI